MKSSLITFAAFFTICAFCSAQAEVNEQHQKWRQELGSEDFKTRVKAMEEVWKSGDEAIIFLEELAAADDPELAIRAATIVQKVKLGIKPDTPQVVVDLIDAYLKSAPQGRIAALEKLRDLGEFDFFLKLRRSETSPRVIDRMDGILMPLMPRIVRTFLNEKRFAEAKEVLGLSDEFKDMIQLGELLRVTGGLDEEIAKLAEPVNEVDSARYLAYLRVKGDVGLLRREAKRLDDRTAEVLAALAEGDHVPYFEYLLGKPSLRQVRAGAGGLDLTNQHYLKWALANHRGDAEAQKKARAALEYLGEQVSEEGEAQVDLFRMGYGKEVIEGLNEEYLETKISYYLMQENYAKARDLIGLPEAPEREGWIKATAGKAEQEIEKSERGPGVGRLIAAAEFLEARGMIADATRCVLILFDLARGKEDLDLGSLGREMIFSAPVSVLTAVAREIEEHEALPATFISKLSGSDDEHLWLFRTLKEISPKMETRERLLHTFSFSSRHLLVPVARHDEVFEKVLAHVLAVEDPQAGLAKMFMILQYRNREPELFKILDAQEENGAQNGYLRGLLALESGRLNAAAELLGQAVANAENPAVASLYQFGLILNKAGKEGGENFIKKAELFSNGSSKDLAVFSDQHLRFGEVKQSHELLRRALLRSPILPTPGDYSGVSNVLDGLSAGAATLGNWQEALAYREVVALTSANGGISYGVYYLRNRFQILVARGALAMANGDVVKAVSAFVEAHRILPRDGYLANELFPVMREVGLSELHDQLFFESARHAREVIQMFPKDDNAHNNFAWLASRANRCLDEAEGYLEIALKINPQSAAYLDTMGEIYFARKDREAALKWSTLSLENQVFGRSASRWELHQQNQRFKSGEFPVQ
ncbi:MAG: tetratricopeptide (TPR) repeat protein [Akkermansiaceae bacterium]|jgi:tetratricopeptide (TPR) repeat protein